MLEVLTELVGRPIDSAKSLDDQIDMVVLGALVRVRTPERSVITSVDPVKAWAWKALLVAAVLAHRLQAGDASKMAGRLSFAVTSAADKCGRAYIRAFHAQACAPLPGGFMGPKLMMSALWVGQYLDILPATSRRADTTRQHAVGWVDAASSPLTVSAVLFIHGRFWYTYSLVPSYIVDQLLERGDNQIGVAECLALIVFLASFRHLLKDTLLTLYTDNQGVLGSVINGSSTAPEMNMIVGSIWLRVAADHISLDVYRVESAANIADGPSRFMFDLMLELNAQYTNVVWPECCRDLWTVPNYL